MANSTCLQGLCRNVMLGEKGYSASRPPAYHVGFHSLLWEMDHPLVKLRLDRTALMVL